MDIEARGDAAAAEMHERAWLGDANGLIDQIVSRNVRAFLGEVRSHLRPLHGGVRDLPGILVRSEVELRWRRRSPGLAHALPKPLIVSLTSYSPRFHTLVHSLKCLLTQRIAPDRVVLWIAKDDFAHLPRNVLDLRREGLDIEVARDLLSFKKLVPALRQHPDAFIVSADDDVSYPSTWLSELVEGYCPRRQEVPATRVHRVMLGSDGAPEPYMKWTFDIPAEPASPLNLATGVGGVLYPPGSLHPDVLDENLFLSLCPTSDDLWFYFMERRAGWCVRKVGPRRPCISWPGSQRVALQHANVVTGGGNDRQLASLIGYFGSPFKDLGAARPERPANLRAFAASCTPAVATPTRS